MTDLRTFWQTITAATITGLAISAVPARAQTPAASPPLPAQPMSQAAAPAQPGQVLRISMDEAVQMALEHQLGLQAARLDLQAADHNIAGARAAFLPQVSANLSRQSAQRQATANDDGTFNPSTSTFLSAGPRVDHQLPWYGGRYNVSWNNNRSESSGGGTFNPRYSSSLSINFTQPLWQGLTIDSARAGVERAQRTRVIADLQLQQRMTFLEVQVKSAYLTLISAIERNKVANENMRVAEESLRQARARVEVGVAPEIEIIEGEAQVESERDSVISSEADIQDAKDQLRSLIIDPARPDYWSLDLEPTDTIEVAAEPPQIDVNAAIATALANRLDLAQARRSIEITELNVRLAESSVKPSVNLSVNYLATADGGTRLDNVALTRSFGTVLSDTFSGSFPTWTVGLNVGYPIGQSAAKATLAQQRVQQQQQLLLLREQELAIMESVRNAARRVETSYRRVVARQRSREAIERNLDAEERRFAVGLSSTFTLQSRQAQLFNARFNEVQAMLAHQLALITFERVQKIQ